MNIFKSILNPILTSILCFTLTVLQAYWAMGEYSTSISSACIDCSFYIELIIVGLITIIPIFLIQTIFYKMKWSKFLSLILILLYLIIMWFKYINTNIFKTREADWSTFSDHEIDVEVLSRSTTPIIVCISLYIVFYLAISKFLSNQLKN